MKESNINHLRIILTAGIILFVLAGSVLTVFYLIERSGSKAARQQDSFQLIMRGFDEEFEGLFFTESEFDRLNGRLDRMEKLAVSVDSWLSILKRRRALAEIHPFSADNYRKSIENALNSYPYSQPITAIAAASLVKNSRVNSQTAQQIRSMLPSLTEPFFNTFRVSMHVLIGDFENPESAEAIPSNLYTDGTELITLNLAVLKTIRGDYRGALSDIQMLMNNYGQSDNAPSEKAVFFAADFNYDFGSMLRSAEIFSYLSDERSMIRQADALYLSGYKETASAIWEILSESSNETSLYNLASASNDPLKAVSYLERLVNIEKENLRSPAAGEFGLVRYSRTFDYLPAVTLLNNNQKFPAGDYPYIDLEICRRHAQVQNSARQAAEAWLLLDRHEQNENIYKWVFRNLFFNRNYAEAKILFNRMEQLKLDYYWINYYKALYLMSEGSLDTAENVMRNIAASYYNWQDYANLGRILEAARSPSRALEQYEAAVLKMDLKPENFKAASAILVRMAGCYTALRRPIDALNSLRYAVELDPGNMTAHFELEKF